MVISWLMKEKGMSLSEATNLTRSKRWFINPNPGFVRQLKAFEKELELKKNEPKTQSTYYIDDQMLAQMTANNITLGNLPGTTNINSSLNALK